MPACAPVLRLMAPLMSELSSVRALLVLLADVVEVEDCCAILTGDHDARAMAKKVSDGDEPSHPASPQHCQTSVLGFQWIHVAPSLAGCCFHVSTAMFL